MIMSVSLFDHLQVGDHMGQFCRDNGILTRPRRSLIGSYFANRHLIATDLLQWYLQQGFQVGKVHYVAQFHRKQCFKMFAERIMNGRRAADKDPSLKIRSDVDKMVGNSASGR